MSPKTHRNLYVLALLLVTAAALVTAGCTSSMVSTATQASAATGPTFVVGTDAPLASVVSFQLQLTDIELTNSTTKATSGPLLSKPATIDFARYNGLQGLVDMTGVQPGTYDGVTITMGTAQIGYLNTSTSPPSIVTEAATLTSPTATVSLPNKLTVNTTGGVPVGLRLDLDLSKSIPVSGGNFSTMVTPTFDVSAVARTDQGAHIDEFIGGVVTPPTGTNPSNSFVIQGPHGENFTINTTSSTEWDNSTLAQLETDGTSAIVAVAGQFDPADQTLDADEVAILTDSKFYADGLVTYVTPATGQATAMDFYVRAVLPSDLTTEVPLGGIADVTITSKENYGIFWMHNAFTQLLFNAYALTPGQEIAVGGPDPSASPFTVNRIHLRNWGYTGTIVSGSQNSGQGSFQMQITGFAGTVVPSTSPVTVYLGPQCDFRYGFGSFGDLGNGTTVRVVGILIKNTTNGQLVLLARHVDGFNFTDFSTFAF